MTTDTVFICYSNKDVDRANEIANSLKSAGANIWIDTINGKDDDLIQEAIISAKLFLIVTSNSALDDEALEQEKKFARDNKIDRFLVIIEPSNIDNKMRWNTLPSVEYSVNNEMWLQTILGKLNIKTELNKVEASVVASPIREVVNKVTSDEEEIKNPESKIEATPPVVEQTSVVSDNELLNELTEDFEYYRFKINNQIRSTYYGLGALVAASVVLLIGLYMFDGLQQFMKEGQEKLKYLGTVGGLLPSTLSTFSLSKIKEKKKRRDGIEDFERILSRMKKGLVPSSKEHIIELEDDFIKYTKS